MKKFFIKSTLFIIPFILLFNIPKVVPLTFHEDLNRKINTLIDNENKPNILIGGDSRAERQLDPYIFEDRLGLNSVNIAVNSGDIVILYNALKKYDLIDQNNILIISVSSIELNDNVVNKWGIPHAGITYISFINNIKLFGEHYINMLHERIRLIFDELFTRKSQLVLNESDNRIETKGFMKISGDISDWIFDSIDIYKDTLKTGWYINAEHNGVRKIVFNKIIKKLAATDMNIILFQPPVSPSWYTHVNGSYIDSIELDHSKFLKSITSMYDNISFIDFYTNHSTVYHDSMYYNSVHFNYEGAELFTNMMVDSLISRKLIKANSAMIEQ